MDRASKILNIAIEIRERCELHICSPCAVTGGHSIHRERWQPSTFTPLKRRIFIRALMLENTGQLRHRKLSFLPVLLAGCRLASAQTESGAKGCSVAWTRNGTARVRVSHSMSNHGNRRTWGAIFVNVFSGVLAEQKLGGRTRLLLALFPQQGDTSWESV